MVTIFSKVKNIYTELFVTYRPEIKNTITAAQKTQAAQEQIPRYPPIDQGIPLYSIESLVNSQQVLIDRIKKTAGVTPEHFELYFFPVVSNLANYIHLLPATKTGNHRGAGGLFRLALELGLHSLQIANSSIFQNKGAATSEERIKIQPRWVYATFISAICSELYRPITDYYVVNSNGDCWQPFLDPLFEWASRQSEPYRVVWNPQSEIDHISVKQASTAYIVNAIVPKSALQYLLDASQEIFPAMTVAITNASPNGAKNQIQKILSDVRKKVIERDLQSNSERYGDFLLGSHLEPSIIDAMRKLIRKNVWDVNVKGSRIWASSEGFFLIWQPAVKEILATLKENECVGIPSEPDTLADILINSGFAEQTNNEGRYWEICLPTNSQIYSAIKITQPNVLFQSLDDVKLVPNYLLLTNINKLPPKKIDQIQHDQCSTGQDLPVVKKTPEPISEQPKQVSEKIDLPANTKDNDGEIALGETDIEPPQILMPPMGEAISNIASQNPIEAIKPASDSSNTEDSKLPETAARLLQSLPRDSSDFLQSIIEDYIEQKSTGPIFSVENGVAISSDELESHGLSNFTGLVKALSDKGWLWTDPDKPLKKLVDNEFQGKKIKGIVVRTDIARSLGFNWKKPK